MEAIDGIADPWECGNYMLESFRRVNAFHYQGKFYQWDEQWKEISHDHLHLVIMRTLKEKCTQAKISLIMDRLRIELENAPKPLGNRVPFANGFFDVDLGIMRPGVDYRLKDRRLLVLPFTYDPLASHLKWDKFLADVFEGDEDKNQKVSVLQEFFGYCMIDANMHKALVLYGDGGNGKSVILDILAAMLPKVSRLEWSELADQRSLERLADSWLNCSTEIAYRDSNSTTGFKKAIAQEVMTANPKYKRAYDFTPRAKFAFATNGLPMIDDPSSGVFRRLIILTLNNSFVGKEDWNLTDTLESEIPGIFNWAMVGALRLIKEGGFTDVPSNVTELQEYRRAINSMQSFYDEDLCMRKGEDMTFADFYRKYTSYCLETNNKPYARNKIRSLIKQLGLQLEVYQSEGNNRRVMALVNVGNESLTF